MQKPLFAVVNISTQRITWYAYACVKEGPLLVDRGLNDGQPVILIGCMFAVFTTDNTTPTSGFSQSFPVSSLPLRAAASKILTRAFQFKYVGEYIFRFLATLASISVIQISLEISLILLLENAFFFSQP